MPATWDEARRCPRCSQVGEKGATKPTLRRGVRVVMVWCRTEGCPWEDTAWPVQINEDGSIPDAAADGVARGPKQFGNDNQLSAFASQVEVDNANRQAAGLDKPATNLELGG